jgi:hypothetical protein
MVLRTGAMTLPAMMVRVAEARMTAREERFDLKFQIPNFKFQKNDRDC